MQCNQRFRLLHFSPSRTHRKTTALLRTSNKGEVIVATASPSASIKASDSLALGVGAPEAELGALKGVTVDLADGVVEGRRRVGEAPDELGCVGAVVVLVAGDAERVALVGDGLRVLLAGGDGAGRGHLVGAGDGQVNGGGALVLHDGVAGHGGGGEGAGKDGEGGGELHFD